MDFQIVIFIIVMFSSVFHCIFCCSSYFVGTRFDDAESVFWFLSFTFCLFNLNITVKPNPKSLTYVWSEDKLEEMLKESINRKNGFNSEPFSCSHNKNKPIVVQFHFNAVFHLERWTWHRKSCKQISNI